VPRECRELADVVAREHGHVHRSLDLASTPVLRLLERCDALRRPERFDEVLLACECDARGRLHFEVNPYPQREHLRAALAAALTVDSGAIARKVTQTHASARDLGTRIALAVHEARAHAVAQALPAPQPG
jgi:tRNA nucleotidyltransferase (CCA-adding enzyme)